MYMDYALKNGALWVKTRPAGPWKEASSDMADVVQMLLKLTDAEREKAFSLFCPYCGADDPCCQCWKDGPRSRSA